MKIQELQDEYARKLAPLAPEGFHPIVELRDQNGQTKLSDEDRDSWNPESGSVRITFSKDRTLSHFPPCICEWRASFRHDHAEPELR